MILPDADLRKKPFLQAVSLRIGGKPPSLRDRTVNPPLRLEPAAGPTSASTGRSLGRLKAGRQDRRRENGDRRHEEPSESDRYIRYLRIPRTIRPRYPHI